MRNQLRRIIALGFLVAASAQAATNIIDFNTDPAASGLYTDIGVGEWRPTGGASGAANDGYLKITDARGGEVAKLVFKDLEPGLVVKEFEFECDLRIGGGTARPADGFSLNFVSATDPMVTDVLAGTLDSISNYSGTDNEVSLPEEGGRTGLGIGFDTWSSATINGVQDVVGISIRVDGNLIAQLPVPLQLNNVFTPGEPNPTDVGNETFSGPEYTYNGVPFRNLATNAATYAQSMQTGALNTTDDLNEDGTVDGADANAPQVDPTDPRWNLWIKNLKWEKFRAIVAQNGSVSIFWKGVELTPPGGLPTTFNPIPGRLVFGGRTGGAWEVHHIDNIRLVTIPADFILIGNAVGNPIGFTITTSDSGPAVSDTNTIVLKFNDVAVTPSEVTKSAGLTTIKYANLAAPLVVGSTNKVSLTISDTRGQSESADRFFTVPAYQTLPAAYAVTGVDTAQPGFNITWHQTATLGQPNTVARAEQQLRGLRGANLFATPTEAIPGVINYEQAGASAGSWNLNTSAGGEYTDTAFPLADPAYTDNIAAEIETYLFFPEPGVYSIVFSSDDGFRTTVSPNINEVLTPFLASQFDGGRGATDVPFASLLVPTAGYYPFRTVWFEGGGGASFEWAADRIAPNSMARALINDTLRPSVKAFRARTGTTPAAVSFLNPFTSSGSPYLPTVPLTVELEQGTDAIDQNSIVMKVNGTAVTPTKATVGNKTTLNYDPPADLPSGTNTVEVSFAAGTQQYAGTNSFTVLAIPGVPPSLALPASAVNTANVGFLFKIRQQDSGESMANDTYRGLVQNAGLIGLTNTANLTAFTGPNGSYVETTVINYDQVAGAAVGFFNAANNYPDANVPGIPGAATSDTGTDNFVAEILTVLDLQVGTYAMNVNSDDGFILTIGNPAEGFNLPVTVGEFSGGRGSGTAVGDGTTFYFNITQAGLYPARLIWYEGGGGANIEWSRADIDANGNLTTFTLINDVSTPGHVKAYQYPVTSAGAPYVKSFQPARSGRGDRAGANTPIKAEIVDGVNAVNPATVSLVLDNTPVTLPPTAVTKTGNTTTLNYQPPAAFAPSSTHSVALTFGDRTVNWSFTVNSSNLNTSAFYIEAEDFNYGGGQTKPEASVMPYSGGAYSGLSATQLIDYDRGNEGSSPIYRIGENPQVPMDRTGDRDRGLSEIVVNYKLGWTGTGQWFNYTRTFPADTYNVYAGLSHGDAATTATRVGASLDRVTSDPAQPGQTTVPLGTFDGPATGGWGNNALIPLRDTTGALVALNLSGLQTLRMNLLNGDFDFIEFVPQGVAPIQITGVSVTGGQVTVTWTGGGTLYSSGSLSTPNWATTGDSDGSYSAAVGAGSLFFRVQSP